MVLVFLELYKSGSKISLFRMSYDINLQILRQQARLA